MIGVDVLAQQGDFLYALGSHPARFLQNLFHGARKLCTSGIWHHAETAELVATLLDRQEGRDGLPRHSADSEPLELVLGGKLGLDHGLSRSASLRQQLRQSMVGLGTKNEVDGG